MILDYLLTCNIYKQHFRKIVKPFFKCNLVEKYRIFNLKSDYIF